ncbi:MAG TPA: hypothetical protein VHQ22_14290 [Terriglobales bacterium]|nr:hypothetical protein [Terriglobales bacterium]
MTISFLRTIALSVVGPRLATRPIGIRAAIEEKKGTSTGIPRTNGIA